MTLKGLWLTGVEGALPAAGVIARLYFATDTPRIFLDTGSAWVRLNLVHRGTYAGGTTYYEKDLVTYNGSVWRALATVTGVTPVEGANWTLFVSKGDAGSGLASIDGVSNTGGDVDLVAGSNVTITPNDAANTITIAASGGSPPFSDSLALVQDNIDSTKKMNIECADIGTGQWRSLTMPNANVDLTPDVSFPAMSTFNARDFKNSVRVATTAAGTLASSFENGDTVDGITLATGNRILIKNQATGSENGIYTVNASGAPTRATDADTSAKVTPQLFVRVEEGTANGGKAFVLTNTGAITLGTTALTFTENTPAPAAHATSHNIGGSDPIQRFIEKDFIFQGALPTANGTTTGTLRVPIIVDSTIVGITVTIDALPVGAGSSQTLDLLRSGTTVYTTTANRPSFVPGGSQFITATLPDVTALTGGTHYLKANLVTAGSPSSGGTSIVMTVRYRQ